MFFTNFPRRPGSRTGRSFRAARGSAARRDGFTSRHLKERARGGDHAVVLADAVRDVTPSDHPETLTGAARTLFCESITST